MLQRLTKEVDNETIAVAVDIGGRVGLELDGDVCAGGVELKVGLRSSVLTQCLGCKVISIIKGQEVIYPNVQSESTHRRKSLIFYIY